MKDVHLTAEDYKSIRHSILMFQCIYCTSLTFVKSSICLALIRLATSKFVLVISAAYGLITVCCLLTVCEPLPATWGEVPGKCADQDVVVKISYFVSACSIFTDLACCILPYAILWNLQMARRLEFTIDAMLSLGFIASAATIVRIF
ncbi:Hypothetical protein D9617_57g029050 [Elsinoe fawcettii]|nr:Hypothetical protein D9617_57g029050 [Elsinoe fawcettii]